MTAAALPSISVALGTYNSTRYLERQLVSILDQDLPVAEVVVSDDGSSDGTLDLVATIAADHPHGSVVRALPVRRSGGVARNFARAIGACAGEAIALSDHDDVWLPHKARTLASRLATGATLAFSDAFIIDGNGERTGQTLFGSYSVTEAEIAGIERGDALSVLDRRNIVTGATVMVDGDFARRAMPAGTSWVHDEWLAYLAAATGSVAVVREPLTEYRVHGANQIGVPTRSAPAQFVHGLRAGSARYKMHRDRTLAMMRALSSLGASDEATASAYARLAFDNARLAYPSLPWARRGPIARQVDAGAYARFTDDPATERWRDLLQRP